MKGDSIKTNHLIIVNQNVKTYQSAAAGSPSIKSTPSLPSCSFDRIVSSRAISCSSSGRRSKGSHRTTQAGGPGLARRPIRSMHVAFNFRWCVSLVGLPRARGRTRPDTKRCGASSAPTLLALGLHFYLRREISPPRRYRISHRIYLG